VVIASPIDWYGFPVPKVTDPSVPTSGVSHAPPAPSPSAFAPGSAPITELKLHSSLPVDASSARSTPPPGPDP
jgi:hypothetical protein